MPTELMQGWSDFFVAEAGASAALAGLLFVAVSINLSRILEFRQLPIRAAEALMALFSVLVVATLGLVPRQPAAAYGAEIGLTGLAVWAAQTMALVSTRKIDQRHRLFGVRFLLNQLPPIPFVVAGARLIAGHADAVYWVVPGTVLSYAAGIYSAWVLLIEIQR